MTIFLCGFMGCGKTTVGEILAKKLGLPLIDTDAYIVEQEGKSIPDIFAQDGEPTFRDWETQALTELGKQSGLVIATGGGCVTQERNYPLLHQNGYLVWLERDCSVLPTDGRPLSQANDLGKMYAVRKPLYEAFADIRVENTGTPAETVQKILDALEELP